MTINNIILKPIIKKLKKEIQDETGYEADIVFNDPISLKIKDGGARLHVNFDTFIDANFLLKIIDEIDEEET